MRILAALFFLAISSAASATSQKDAIDIYNNLVKSLGMKVYPKLRFSSDGSINAGVGPGGMYINAGMLRATNKNELAFVIGHEIAHYRLGHWVSNYENEFAADRYGYMYAKQAGYNMCQGVKIMKKFYQGASKTHPSPQDRLNRLPKC